MSKTQAKLKETKLSKIFLFGKTRYTILQKNKLVQKKTFQTNQPNEASEQKEKRKNVPKNPRSKISGKINTCK